MTQESLTEKLASHLLRPIDEATRQRARLHLLDWLGCVAGARQSRPARKPFGSQSNRSAWLGNVLEMDDVHRTAILHPGPVIWPMLETPTGSMQDVLDSAIRGYEAIITIGSTFDDRHYAYYHNTATAGIFGAAIASLSPDRPDAETMVNAMGLAGSITGGLWQMRHEQSDAKQWHISHAYLAGIEAAMAAEDGAIGPKRILEGKQGLYAATCHAPKPMIMSDPWQIHQVSFKPWGACRHAHPAIDAALEYQRQYGALDGDIMVETYADALAFCDQANPANVIQAKFSLQHALAIVAQKGEPELADFELDAISHFAETRKRVSVKHCATINTRYPNHYGARISCNGHVLELIDALGDPERPMSIEQIIAKTYALISWGGLAQKEAERAVDLALYGDEPEAIAEMLKEWLS